MRRLRVSAVDLSQATVVCDHLPLWPALKSESVATTEDTRWEKKTPRGAVNGI